MGASGLYDIEGLTDTHWKKINSAYSNPSDTLLFRKLNGNQVAFLPRHARGHIIPPSEIDYKANIDTGNDIN